MYQLIAFGVKREDGAEIPFADGNTDYEAYKLWLANGNTPEPMVPVPFSEDVWTEFRAKRDLYLSRLADIAGRYYRKGDAAVPPAADAMAQGLLDMPARADLAAPLFAVRSDMERAIVVAVNQLFRAQLTDQTTAPTIKAALDSVFKA